jgi:hypothetical protein
MLADSWHVPSSRMRADELEPNLADPLAVASEGPWVDEEANRDQAKTRSSAPPPEYGYSGPIYLAAFAGTAVAGGLFPIVLVIALIVFAGPPPNVVFQSVAIVFVGGLVGMVLAAAVALCIFPLVGAIQWLAGLYPWRVAMASIAGGWTGFVATQATIAQVLTNEDLRVAGLILTWIAMAMGQVFAGWAGTRHKRLMAYALKGPEPEARARFTVRQMLGLTTGLAVITAIISALDLPYFVHAALLSSMLLQGIGLIAWRVLGWPSSSPGTRRESSASGGNAPPATAECSSAELAQVPGRPIEYERSTHDA